MEYNSCADGHIVKLKTAYVVLPNFIVLLLLLQLFVDVFARSPVADTD